MLKRWLIAIAALAGIALTTSLGAWQWGRGTQRTALHEAIEARRNTAPVSAAELFAASDPAALLHRPVVLRGQWVPQRTVFLDNRQMNGVPGFYVVTPLRLEGAPGVVEVRGRLAPPPAKLYAFDKEEKGPIRQNLDLTRFRAETGLPLLPYSVQQAGTASEGLLRQWPQAGSGAEKNFGYAFQWWAIAALIAILYVWFQLLVPRRQARRA